MTLKFYISPSGQEGNTGPHGYNEQYQMNKVADRVCAGLKLHKQEYLRNSPDAPGVETYCIQSNAYGPDYHIAIHSNATGGINRGTRGCEVYTDLSNPKAVALAKILYDNISLITPNTDRGIKDGTATMSEIAHVNAPSVLIEVDYHDISAGALWIMNNINTIADAIIKSLVNIAGETYIPFPTPGEIRLQAQIDALRAAADEKAKQIIAIANDIIAL